jgi:hypothetical protein
MEEASQKDLTMMRGEQKYEHPNVDNSGSVEIKKEIIEADDGLSEV